ncbi:HTH domain-containing protein [Microbacterium sp.]|nr:HTH domain-containing protein [Microbacterium sp.]
MTSKPADETRTTMSAKDLAERFQVDTRTIERDRSEPGRRAA